MAQSLLKSVFAGGYSKLFTYPAKRRMPPPTPHQFQFHLRINAFSTSSKSSSSRDFLSLSDELPMDQCEMNTFKASGPGGQHRNKPETTVGLEHSPTGIIAQAVEDRSQHKNRASALSGFSTLQDLKDIWVFPPKEREQYMCKTLQGQIEYYFSDANLVKDTFLKSNMDNEGWVSVDLISGFPRVKRLTQDKILILKALQPSNVIEVQGNKMRRRGNWMDRISPHGSSSSTHLTTDKQVTGTQKLKLDGDSCEIDAQEEIKQNIGTANGGNEGA